MISDFGRQMEPCARKAVSVPQPPAAPVNSAPLIPPATRDKSAPAWTLEHETQAAFLKALIAYEDGEASRQLRESLAKAERESTFIRRAISLMVILFLLSLAGLAYCAQLLPQIFGKPTHFVTTSLCILGLVSLISQLEFGVYLVWHRFAVDRLHKECRRRVLLLVESQIRVPPR
jgi:hypothetical protein